MLSETPQTLANCLVSASLYVLIGVGFGLLHRAGRFFHLAHGMVFAAGAYAAWALLKLAHIPSWAAFPTGIALSAMLGPALWYLTYRPIWRRSGSPLALFLGSLGAYIVLQNCISLLFGDSMLQVRTPYWGAVLSLGGAYVSRAQLALIALAVVCTTAAAAVLRLTGFGRDIRAVGDDPALAGLVGVNVERLLLWALVAASAVAGAAGIFAALDTDLRPTMGFQPLLLAVSASILGGIGDLRGLVVAAVALAAVQQFGAWFVPVHWAESVALIALFSALVIRPRGLWATRRRSA